MNKPCVPARIVVVIRYPRLPLIDATQSATPNRTVTGIATINAMICDANIACTTGSAKMSSFRICETEQNVLKSEKPKHYKLIKQSKFKFTQIIRIWIQQS